MDNVVELFPIPPGLTGAVSVFAEGKKVKGTKGRARYVAPRHVEIDFKLTDEGVVILMDDITLTISPDTALAIAEVLVELTEAARDP